MSSLKEVIAARKALSRPDFCCVETDHRPVSMVTFCPWQAKAWALPWARLDALSFSYEEEAERVEFFFSHHHVIVTGENLLGIMDDLRTFRVRCLRDLPALHHASHKPGTALIHQLEVRSLADAPNRALAVVPLRQDPLSGESENDTTRVVFHPPSGAARF